MDKEEKIEKIIGILKDVEERLSDGYVFYQDEDGVDHCLREIAERIIKEVL